MISLYSYHDIANFGDALGWRLVEYLSGQKVVHCTIGRAQLAATGSILFTGAGLFEKRHSLLSVQTLRDVKGWLNNLRSPALAIWGSGFINSCGADFVRPLRTMKLYATRGRLTADIFRRSGVFLSEEKLVYGDPGLLFPMLLDETAQKTFDVGVVPHFVDSVMGKQLTECLSSRGVKTLLVDVGQSDPLNVVREISTCKTVISSSLHGLIVADAMGIPNRQVMLSLLSTSEKATFDDYAFKFRDYYSAYGMEMPRPMQANEVYSNPEQVADLIRRSYRVDKGAVEQVKKDLLDSFPFRVK